MKKLALYFVLAVVITNCKKSGDVTAPSDKRSLDQSGRWRLKEFRESFGVPVHSWVQPIADTFYVEFMSNNVFKSNTSFFASRTQYQILNDSLIILSAFNAADIQVKTSFVGPYLQLDGPCFEPCNYRFVQ